MQLGNVQPLNSQIDKWASSKTTNDSPITIVDCFTGFNPARGSDTSDGVHPNDSGDKKVAACFYSAVAAAIKATQ
jgi:lysophospholipase L1-like esterase